MKKVNILIGRFQPFTKGHLKCVEEAYDRLHIPTVIAMIETPDSKVDARHPFPSSMLLPIYKEMFKKNPMVDDIILVKNADIVKISEALHNRSIASWTCGTDRIESYSKMTEKYHDQAHLDKDFQMIEIKRGDEDVSATKARAALMADDRKTYSSLVPQVPLATFAKIGDVYEILRDQLMKVNNNEREP